MVQNTGPWFETISNNLAKNKMPHPFNLFRNFNFLRCSGFQKIFINEYFINCKLAVMKTLIYYFMTSASRIYSTYIVSRNDQEIPLRPSSPSRLKADGTNVLSWEKRWSQSICQSNTWERNKLHLCFNYYSKTIQCNCQSCTFSWSTRDITRAFFHK